jgi:O-acetyl-ADP-ribose deacetylase (regulator of RNase III)
MVTYVKGDVTKLIGTRAIIAHIVNDEGIWGGGFTASLDKATPAPRNAYKESYQDYRDSGSLFMPLGLVDYVYCRPTIIANMVAQHRTIADVEKPICYKSLEHCLDDVADYATESNRPIRPVYMPRIGAGLARGNWDVIESIIDRVFTSYGIEATVYDL